jgi:type II secretory pathway pseudopilin PulG
MTELISPFVSELSRVLVLILVGIITTFATRSYKSVMDWIDNKRESANNDILQEALWILQTIVKSVVDQAEQTMVIEEKNGNGNKLSPESADKIKQFVVRTTKSNMPNNILELLNKYGVDINSLIITFIEQSVLEGKKQLNNK